MRRCEALEIEHEGATLGDTEEVDAINRGRVERCYLRHAAARACFCALAAKGVLEAPLGGCPGRGR